MLMRAALVVLTCALRSSPASAQSVEPGPLVQGDVTFLIHSSFVGRIEGRAPIARAEFSGDRLAAVRGEAVVRVAAMRTGNGTRDRHLRDAMAADSYPEIRFDLSGVEPGSADGDGTAVVLDGTLTLHGVTRSVRAGGFAVVGAHEVRVAATFSVDMRDYGIKPPVRAVILRVAPDVVVTVRLIFGAGGGA